MRHNNNFQPILKYPTFSELMGYQPPVMPGMMHPTPVGGAGAEYHQPPPGLSMPPFHFLPQMPGSSPMQQPFEYNDYPVDDRYREERDWREHRVSEEGMPWNTSNQSPYQNQCLRRHQSDRNRPRRRSSRGTTRGRSNTAESLPSQCRVPDGQEECHSLRYSGLPDPPPRACLSCTLKYIGKRLKIPGQCTASIGSVQCECPHTEGLDNVVDELRSVRESIDNHGRRVEQLSVSSRNGQTDTHTIDNSGTNDQTVGPIQEQTHNREILEKERQTLPKKALCKKLKGLVKRLKPTRSTGNEREPTQTLESATTNEPAVEQNANQVDTEGGFSTPIQALEVQHHTMAGHETQTPAPEKKEKQKRTATISHFFTTALQNVLPKKETSVQPIAQNTTTDRAIQNQTAESISELETFTGLPTGWVWYPRKKGLEGHWVPIKNEKNIQLLDAAYDGDFSTPNGQPLHNEKGFPGTVKLYPNSRREFVAKSLKHFWSAEVEFHIGHPEKRTATSMGNCASRPVQ